VCRKLRELAKEYALRQETALLHTFVAGQTYGVRRYANRRFCLSLFDKNNKEQQIIDLLLSESVKHI